MIFFKTLTNDFFYFDIITNETQSFFSGNGNVLESLNEGVEKYSKFHWREIGVINIGGVEKVWIEVGDPLDRPFRGYQAESINPMVDGNNGDNIEILNPTQRQSGNITRSIIPRIQNVQGADPASIDITFITDNNKDLVSETIPGFTLEPSGQKAKTAKGSTNIYKVVNQNADPKGRGTYTNIQTPTSYNEKGLNVSAFPQIAYNRAVWSLLQKEEKITQDIQVNTPYILPAGEPFIANYQNVLPNGDINTVAGTQYIGEDMEYTISEFIL